ncbi:G-protein beta WD-40 repeats containing protein [Reticulomyxa filosa]|uniref:G-protein beta WD-40 repeats containing protein n=1 Tax=Reticulomyxa filosa TaxID=46433 RepID=X6N6T1_RETFI|nr:G-protein beta WD-40 repeats containing protein [Reticulomyxa filosa]|eukprot:ETO21756.1 G-protein beta WD-40 repeats containing protein [Reticulomyxa filosa]
MTSTDMKVEEIGHLSTKLLFQTLPPLPYPLKTPACVAHKQEILICGGDNNSKCYSYHIPTKKYKYICCYPKKMSLYGHCVVKLLNKENLNDITLLSFGGFDFTNTLTLVMKYKSVWENNEEVKNEWTSLTDDNNSSIYIRSEKDSYMGARAIVGGNKNNLLFITYYPQNIDILDLNTYKYIKRDILPITTSIRFHCFISNKEKEMYLFHSKNGLKIKYNEEQNIFQFTDIRICTAIRSLYSYSYLYVDDIILFFGGNDISGINISKDIYSYSIQKDKWIKYEQTLPYILAYSTAILSEDNKFIFILGGSVKMKELSTNIITNVKEWKKDMTQMEKKWFEEEEERKEDEDIQKDLTEGFDIKKLKVKKKLFKTKEITIIMRYWIHLLSIKRWVNDITIIIFRYILQKYFKPLKYFQEYSVYINNAKFSPDGTKIVSSSAEKIIEIWDITSGKVIKTLKGHTHSVYNVEFSSDGNMIVSCSEDGTIRLWDIRSEGNEIKKLQGHSDYVTCATFSLDCNMIVSCSYDTTIRIWNVYSGKEIKKLEGHSLWINNVQFSSNNKYIVSSSNDNTIGIWDLQSGNLFQLLKGHSDSVTKAFFSSNNHFIVSSSDDNTIRLWDVTSGKELQKFEGHSKPVKDIRFFPDCQTIVSCSTDKTIRLWDIKLGVEIQKLDVHADWITGLDVSPDGHTILLSSWDKPIHLWVRL